MKDQSSRQISMGCRSEGGTGWSTKTVCRRRRRRRRRRSFPSIPTYSSSFLSYFSSFLRSLPSFLPSFLPSLSYRSFCFNNSALRTFNSYYWKGASTTPLRWMTLENGESIETSSLKISTATYLWNSKTETSKPQNTLGDKLYQEQQAWPHVCSHTDTCTRS
jgi:hypothetical protein